VFRVSGILSIAIFGTIFIGYLVRASPKASNHFVWATFVNETGWSDAVCFMTGLVTPSFMYGGLDASLHLSERRRIPGGWSLWSVSVSSSSASARHFLSR
jgi:choline transport protein